MEDKSVIAMILGFVLLVAICGLVISFSPSSVGMYSVYPQAQGADITNYPDPHTQFVPIDDSICVLAQQRPATFESFIALQCKSLNPGRQARQGYCQYQAKLDAQLKCLSAPVFQNIEQPQNLV
jgi:hypothetical protein